MQRCALPRRAERDLVRVRLRVGDEFPQRLHRQARRHADDVRLREQAGDRREVALDAVRQLLGREGTYDERGQVVVADGVAIGCGLRHHVQPDRAGRTRFVFNDERLPQALLELDGQHARRAVGSARRGIDDQAHGLFGVLGVRDLCREQKSRCQRRCQFANRVVQEGSPRSR